jgi:hypothetical protein
MFTSVSAKKLGRHCAVAALILGVGFSANSISQVSAQPDVSALETVRFTPGAQPATAEAAEVQTALTTFIRGMAEGDAKTVWMYASEEDQAAFETEEAVLAAFADSFPALTEAEDVKFDSFRNEGDTPFAMVSFADEDGNKFQADVGLWLDDAGDWKVVSCEVNAVTDRVASL